MGSTLITENKKDKGEWYLFNLEELKLFTRGLSYLLKDVEIGWSKKRTWCSRRKKQLKIKPKDMENSRVDSWNWRQLDQRFWWGM